MTSTETNTKSWGARWVVPVDQPPLENACLIEQDGLIVSIEPGGRASADQDLGEVAITPMLVNAHTHLEFSGLTQPLGQPNQPITDWIPEVIRWRSQQTPEQIQAAIAHGIKQSIAFGVNCLGEIATSNWLADFGSLDEHFHLCWFLERLGSDPSVANARIQEAQDWLAGLPMETLGSQCQAAISPHAPYSLCQELFEGLIEWSVARNLPVAMHLAESREELQWLESGAGPFQDFYDLLPVPAPKRFANSPLQFLQALTKTPNALVVHGNYLSEEEIRFIGRHDHLHLVYCPRTHQYFGHDRWPLESAIQHGVNVCVGTDSLASNPDLDLMAELKLIQAKFPNVPPQTIFEMGTINGARALQFDSHLGSLTAGKLARFLTFELKNPQELWPSIFDGVR